jgi:hypothetical protein
MDQTNVAIVIMKWDALIQHLEATLFCEENFIIMQTIIKSFCMLYPHGVIGGRWTFYCYGVDR